MMPISRGCILVVWEAVHDTHNLACRSPVFKLLHAHPHGTTAAAPTSFPYKKELCRSYLSLIRHSVLMSFNAKSWLPARLA